MIALKKYNSLVLVLLLFTSCRSIKSNQKALQINQYVFEVENYSEEMTQNDELYILCYDWPDTNGIDTAFYKNFKVFNKHSRTDTFELPSNLSRRNWMMVLVEQDQESNLISIDSLFRSNYTSIMKHYANKDQTALDRIFGDDDLLHIAYFASNKRHKVWSYEISGRYKLDKYVYWLKVN